MKIAVDFDGTIVEHKYPEIGREIPFAIDALKRLSEDGHQIILWTSREGDRLAEAVEFCAQRGLRFYAVNSEYPEGQFSEVSRGRKIVADLYIDDRNLGGLPEWGEIYEAISSGHQFDLLGGSENGSHHSCSHHHHRHGHKKSLLSRIADRCRSSREKFNR